MINQMTTITAPMRTAASWGTGSLIVAVECVPGLYSGRRLWPAGPWVAADVVEVTQGLGIGVQQAGLGIGQPVLAAEPDDDRLGAAQVGSGHAGEQVVLDLVV